MCDECKPSKKLRLDKAACINNCEDFSGVNTDNTAFKECVACQVQFCKKCELDFKVCTECASSHLLYDNPALNINQCVTNCPVGTVVIGNKCIVCPPNCKLFINKNPNFNL
jgi:hypothetical protein